METNRLPEIEQCRSPEEREFALAILARAEKGDWYGTLWFFEGPLISSVDLIDLNYLPDGKHHVISCTLRADFYGSRVVVGKDPTYQLVHLLDSTSAAADYESDSPCELAQFVANWFESEMDRLNLHTVP